MGTDIDLYVEKRNANGEWELLFPSTDMAEQLHGEFGKDQEYGPTNMSGWAWFSGRNYELFALLAGVRNRFEFTSPWKHRGMPEDSQLKDNDSARYGHSISHVTLQELLDFDWTTGISKSGWMGIYGFKFWLDHGRKEWTSYSQGVGGPNIVKISNEEMEALFKDGTLVEKHDPNERDPEHMVWTNADEEDQRCFQTFCEWTEPMSQACGTFVIRTLPALKEFTKGTDPADIRLTYWFDC